LRRWEEIRPELDARGVQLVTVCTDTPEKILQGRRKHGLKAIMLSDPELAVTNRFGLRNRGFHSGVPGGAPALPVPTTILVDAAGVVRWIDQSENYQRRSDPARLRAALQEHLAT
jgi:peroxiredoxin